MLKSCIPKSRLRRVGCVVLIGLLIALGVYGPQIKQAIDHGRYFRQTNSLCDRITAMSDTPPPTGLTVLEWKWVVQFTSQAAGTVFFNLDHASFEEFEAFSKDFHGAEDLGPEAKVRWIWARLERVQGRHVELKLRNLRTLLSGVLTSQGNDLASYTYPLSKSPDVNKNTEDGNKK